MPPPGCAELADGASDGPSGSRPVCPAGGVRGHRGTLRGLYQHPARTLKENLKDLPGVPSQDGLEGDVGFDAGTYPAAPRYSGLAEVGVLVSSKTGSPWAVTATLPLGGAPQPTPSRGKDRTPPRRRKVLAPS